MPDINPTYRPHLVVYVVWHPKSELGPILAKKIFSHLSRDDQNPVARGIGIPVYYRTATAPDKLPKAIDLNDASYTAVIVLIDSSMNVNADDGWGDYVVDLAKKVGAEPRHQLLPVALSSSAFDFNEGALGNLNFIRASDLTAPGPFTRFLNDVTHQLCGQLAPAGNAKRVSVFISHTKRDNDKYGLKLAEGFRSYITNNMQLEKFFDVNDIPFGEDFAAVLEKNIEQTAVLVVQTDAYSTSGWCDREVLWAKEHRRPVLVINAVREGEKRSFAYLGNVPTVRLDPEKEPDHQVIIGHLLTEVLRTRHFLGQFANLSKLFQIPAGMTTLAHTPELLTLLNPKDVPPPTAYIYPDPPLGDYEVDILKRIRPGLTVTTPVMYLARDRGANAPTLKGTEIAVSIADNADLGRRGLGKEHLEDAMVEFARYVFASGARFAYGGDFRQGGYTAILRELIGIHNEISPKSVERIASYLAWPVHHGLPDKELDPWMKAAKLKKLDRPADLPENCPVPRFNKPEDRTVDGLYVAARSLTEMRTAMAKGNNARIGLGGKVFDYWGRYPGVVEESLLALRAGQPVYLIGGFGGGARVAIDAILGNNPVELTEAAQCKDATYKAIFERYNQNAGPHGFEPIDYPKLVAELKTYGNNGLAKLCELNGLSQAENERLFETPHVIEMVYLVLKGLASTLGKSPVV
ncbi:MAG TPA: TIR domain-containing protein [Gemmataceae bacterium]|jgi:hypothetical protein|nr:TIR domain-containing protein [Gemmataceae bacterium]